MADAQAPFKLGAFALVWYAGETGESKMKPGIRPLPLLVLAFAMGSSGCTRPWKVHACYEGTPRAFADLAVLLVDARMLPVLRVRSIDGVDVPDCVEYHLASGTHRIVSGVSRGQTTDMQTECTLSAGYVYRLAADVWNLSDRLVIGTPVFQQVECDWRPRVTELGRFDELTSGDCANPAIWQHVRMGGLRYWIQAQEGVAPPDETGHCAHFKGTGLMIGSIGIDLLMAKPGELPPKHWGALPRHCPVGQNKMEEVGASKRFVGRPP